MNLIKVVTRALGLLLFIPSFLSAQGIEFYHGSWSEALDKAKSEEKLIFVDAFASWCGPCKRMASQTFPDEEVGAFFNANFICMKIDMEKPENSEFASKYPVRSYPTLMFIDSEGKMVMKDIGAKNVPQLIETGQKALGKNDKSVDYEKKYNDGNRDPQLIYDYVRALNAAKKPSLKYTNEYLDSQSDLTSNFNLQFILEGAIEADSRVFDLLLQHKDKIETIAGAEKVNARIETACTNTLNKGIQFKSENLLEEAKSKMNAAKHPKASAFALHADMTYFKSVKDSNGYLKAAKKYQKTAVKKNAAMMHDLTVDLVRFFPEDKKVLAQALKWGKTAAETGGLPEYWMTLAGIYKLQGNIQKARETAIKTRDSLGDGDAMMKNKIEYFIRTLEG